MKPTLKNMSPTEIRVIMLRAGVTQAEIARELRVTKTSVYIVIEGHFKSDRVRRKIAEKCGMDVARIWPETYLAGGPRKAGRPIAAVQ